MRDMDALTLNLLILHTGGYQAEAKIMGKGGGTRLSRGQGEISVRVREEGRVN